VLRSGLRESSLLQRALPQRTLLQRTLPQRALLQRALPQGPLLPPEVLRSGCLCGSRLLRPGLQISLEVRKRPTVRQNFATEEICRTNGLAKKELLGYFLDSNPKSSKAINKRSGEKFVGPLDRFLGDIADKTQFDKMMENRLI
jgi:hypothetical protein